MENEKLIGTVARHDEQIKQNTRDIDELKDTTALMYKIATSVELLAKESTHTNEKLENMNKKMDDTNTKVDKTNQKVDKLDKDLNDVKSKDDKEDAKKWREGAKYVGLTILGAVIALALKQIGLI